MAVMCALASILPAPCVRWIYIGQTDSQHILHGLQTSGSDDFTFLRLRARQPKNHLATHTFIILRQHRSDLITHGSYQ
jgi:urease accessory protein UreF